MAHNPLSSLPSFGRFELSRAEFEDAVDNAVALIPAELAQAITNVGIVVEESYIPGPGEDPDTVLLGLYQGTPLTERGTWWDAGSLPDRITIYRQPILDSCLSSDEVTQEILVTVVHEIAHHFGINDERLHQLGWG